MIDCPSCAAPMTRRPHERRPSGTLDLDFCHPCHLIWFDQYESTALAPAAVIALFGEIHAHQENPPRPIPEKLGCPKCRRPLKLTHDIQGTSRFTYHRCEAGCGRLTTFFQFLREKQFVRNLAPHEIDRVRAHVAQVRCSSCGARLDLERETACRYCRAPVSILDADAVRKTLAQLAEREAARHRPIDPRAAMEAVLDGRRAKWGVAATDVALFEPQGLDIVGAALHALMEAIDP